MSKRLWTILSICVLSLGAAWIWVSAVYFSSNTNEFIPSPKEGFLAPDFELGSLNGDTYQLSKLKGEVILVNIWASWCSPCRQEMPAIQALYETYHDQGFNVLAVNATNQDSVSKVESFATEFSLTFPILLDVDGTVGRLYLVQAFPSSFFIDRNGIIQEVVIGGPMSEALLCTRVENLLAEGD